MVLSLSLEERETVLTTEHFSCTTLCKIGCCSLIRAAPITVQVLLTSSFDPPSKGLMSGSNERRGNSHFYIDGFKINPSIHPNTFIYIISTCFYAFSVLFTSTKSGLSILKIDNPPFSVEFVTNSPHKHKRNRLSVPWPSTRPDPV